MKINILTLFPEMFKAMTEESIIGRAREKGVLEFNIVDIRDFSEDKHRKVDDTPYGGGVGMLMFCQPIFHALKALDGDKKKILYMSPRGKILDKEKIDELAELEEITILCGHYEGVDQRVIDYWDMEEVSIGDYVLTGGELAAMVLLDAVFRFVPGVLGTKESAAEESVYSGLLEYDQYTKPRTYEEMQVPEVLTGGNHKEIFLWQLENSLRLTAERRPDLLDKWKADGDRLRGLTKKEKKTIEKLLEEL